MARPFFTITNVHVHRMVTHLQQSTAKNTSEIEMTSLIFTALLGLPAALCAVQDTPFLQDVSFRSTYSTSEPIADWQQLPFDLSEEKDQMIHLQSPDCFVGISGGSLFYSVLKNTTQSAQDKINLVDRYESWRVVANPDSVEAPSRIIPAPGSDYNFFILTRDHVFGYVVDSTCASIVSSDVVAQQSFGEIFAATASSRQMWISSSGLGLMQVALSSGDITPLDMGGDVITTLYWVEAWGKLFAGCSATLKTLTYGDSSIVQKTTHEWIGALIDTIPLDFSYDTVNDALWLAENNSVHKLTAAGTWWRIGQRQGSPFDQITSVAAVNGYIWVGSAIGLARVRGDVSVMQKYQTSTSGDESSDPWQWMYFGGNRYLAASTVSALVGGYQGSTRNDRLLESSVIAISPTGIARIDAARWTLAEKAEAMGNFQERHDRHGLTTGINLLNYGDVRTYQQRCDDNDGLWTSMHAMGEAYRYLVTGEEEARELAWKAFESLEMLSILPGDYPHFPARSFTPSSESEWPGCNGDPWKVSTVDPNYHWKSTTSSDEIDGHLAVYPMIYDHIARTPEEKARVYALIEGITGGILANDLYLIDPSTGEPTIWGFWNPDLVNDDPEHYSERGTNSVGILAYTASAYSITGDDKYKKTFWDLAINYDYINAAVNGKIDSPLEDNHSDNELFFQAYHIAMYALQRLKGHESTVLYAEVESMVNVLLPSMHRTFALINGELSPLWLGIYAGTGNQEVPLEAISSAVWTLRHWAIDLIEWPISNDERWDITESPFFARDSTNPLMRQIRPPSERSSRKWNSDPFVLNDQGDGMGEEYPANWRYPYYLMTYNKLIV